MALESMRNACSGRGCAATPLMHILGVNTFIYIAPHVHIIIIYPYTYKLVINYFLFFPSLNYFPTLSYFFPSDGAVSPPPSRHP